MSGKAPRASRSKSAKFSAATTAELDATTADQTTAATLATTARDIETRLIVNPFDVKMAETTAPTADEIETARLATLRADSAKLAAETADPTADAQRTVDAQLTAERIATATAETTTATAETAPATADATAIPPEILATVGRVNGAWDYVAVSAAPAHMLAADATAPTAAPDVMTADQKIATHRAAMSRLSTTAARGVDNANFCADRMQEGRDILAHLTWYRVAFPNSWNAGTTDAIIGEIVTNAMRFVDKGAAKPRPIDALSAEFFAQICETLAVSRDVVERVSFDRIKRLIGGCIAVDKSTLTAAPLAGFADFIRSAVPMNVRGGGSWTRDELVSNIASHSAKLAAERQRIIEAHDKALAAVNANMDAIERGETETAPVSAAPATTAPTAETTAPTAATTAPTAAPATTAPTAAPETAETATIAPETAPETAETAPATATTDNPILVAARLAPETITADQLTAIHRALFSAGNFEALFGAFAELKGIIRDAQTAMLAAETTATAEAQRIAKLAAERSAALSALASAA